MVVEQSVLEQEIDAFMEQLPEMLKEHEGEYTVLKGETRLGFYPDTASAYAAGLTAFGNVPMLIRQVSQEYVVHGKYGKSVLITRLLGV
ncbi:MAG: hypothetical protein V1725_04985 [archaeon]